MYAETKHLQLKKTPAGESGLSESVPLHLPGTVNSDPAGAYFMTYFEQIKSPKWQKKRLEILKNDKFTCRLCGDKESELHVHHIVYHKNKKIWEYSDSNLATLCSQCHENMHAIINDARIAMFLTGEKFGIEAIIHLFSFLKEINK